MQFYFFYSATTTEYLLFFTGNNPFDYKEQLNTYELYSSKPVLKNLIQYV
jgi:hypothetical protein